MILLSDRWQFYKDKVGQWRKFEANRVVSVSADGFHSHKACLNNAKTRGYVVPEKSALNDNNGRQQVRQSHDEPVSSENITLQENNPVFFCTEASLIIFPQESQLLKLYLTSKP